MVGVPLQVSKGASVFGSRGLTLRPCSGQADGEAGGWAWVCGGAGEVAPVGVSGAEGEEGAALGGVDGRVGGGLSLRPCSGQAGGAADASGFSAGWGVGGAGWACGVVGKEPIFRPGPRKVLPSRTCST